MPEAFSAGVAPQLLVSSERYGRLYLLDGQQLLGFTVLDESRLLQVADRPFS